MNHNSQLLSMKDALIGRFNFFELWDSFSFCKKKLNERCFFFLLFNTVKRKNSIFSRKLKYFGTIYLLVFLHRHFVELVFHRQISLSLSRPFLLYRFQYCAQQSNAPAIHLMFALIQNKFDT